MLRSTSWRGAHRWGSPGAQACRAEREAIEAPGFDLQAMTVVGAGRRSVAIEHRNLGRLYLRAWRLPEERFGDRPVRWEGWNDERVRPWLGRTPAAAWEEALPTTADYRDHRSFTTPPLEALGRYLIVASAEPDFRPRGNRLSAVELRLSGLVVLRDTAFGASPESALVRAVEGADGRPVAGAEAALWRWQWEQKPQLVERTTTDAEGLARFARAAEVGASTGFSGFASGVPTSDTSYGPGWSLPFRGAAFQVEGTTHW